MEPTKTTSYSWLTSGASERPRLVVFWEDHVVTRPLSRGTRVVLGRGSDCDVRVDHRSVSRQHLAITAGDAFSVEDLGSSNGTRVAGTALNPGVTQVVEPGQLVAFGIAGLVVQPSGARDFRTPQRVPPSESPWPDSAPMAEVVRLLRLIAPSDISVLLLGETGVGKEVAAEFIHGSSQRSQGPFVRINCAAVPEPLLESELFGHERGAFTGAVRTKPGLVEQAHQGTLFLDEIGELPLATQAKLLRMLDAGEVQRLGSLTTNRVRVRVIAATNRDIGQLVESGGFRQDLYFRLAGMPVEIPPLRQRPREVSSLAERFLRDSATASGRPPPALAEDARAALERYAFPGNVRELRNIVERALVLSEGATIHAAHLFLPSAGSIPPASAPPPSAQPSDLRGTLKAVERQELERALEHTDGNQTAAAKLLGIGRRTLIDKLNEHGLLDAWRRR